MELNSRYSPHEIEDKIYKNWTEKGYFKAVVDKSKEPFVIVMPPPNVTGQLHMGHALDNTIQDVFTRYARMNGKETLWLPGTDHASIATENKVVEKLAKEGITKEMLGREGFLEKAWEWKNKYGGRITQQLKKLGCSCDWTRESFTMDEKVTKAVEYVFVKLYEKGLIYKGERIVNWCPSCRTSISDTEVEYEEKASSFWHIRYKVEGSDEYITIATTRPETMLGDTAVAVNPKDKRYRHLVGKNVILPLVNRKIPVIADDYVEKDFGTGALKITPAHDPNDYEVGKRHGLPVINIMNEDATIAKDSLRYSGMTREEARAEIVKDLKLEGYLVKIEPHIHNAGTCYRCKTIVEPYASKQWFVKMEELAAPAIEAVRKGDTKFIPERFEKIYFNWMENIKDWCISRQLWWGHRIPAYYCDDCNEITVEMGEVLKCKHCGSNKINKDNDVLDTWFSSALWPSATLGWPDKTEDMEYFYPTTMLVTGYDIITFWVSKMIFSGIEHTGEVPFKDVYIHGLVRDSEGRKMSKSLGNGIDPLEVMEEYGTDALRFSLIQNIAPGNDIRYIPEKVEAGRNFANKIWNAARFSLSYISRNAEQDRQAVLDIATHIDNLMPEDKWIVTKMGRVVDTVKANFANFEIGIALSEIYNFVWQDFCDLYIEMIKPRLYDNTKESYTPAVATLNYILKGILKMLHPYMPFISEEIYIGLVHDDNSIMIASYPKNEYIFENETKIINEVIEIVKQVRNIRAESNIPNSKKTNAIIISKTNKELLEKEIDMIKKMAYIDNLEIYDDVIDNSNIAEMLAIHTESIDTYIDMSSVINKEEERKKIELEIKKIEEELYRANKMLDNKTFVAKAPEKLIEAEKEKMQKYTLLLKKLKNSLEKI